MPATTTTLLPALVDGHADGLFVKDLDGRYTVCNRALAELMGLRAEQVLGRTDTELFGPDVAHRLQEEDRRVLRDHTHEVSTHWLSAPPPDGHVYETSRSPLFDGQALCGVAGVVRDVTALQRVKDDLFNERQRRREAQQLGRMGNWEVNLATGVLTVSEQTLALYDIDDPPPVLTADAFVARMHPDDQPWVIANLNDSRRYTRGFTMTYRVVAKDGSIRYITDKCAPVGGRPGAAARLVGSVQEVTDRVLKEQAMQRMNEELERRVQERTAELDASVAQLKRVNQGLETFTYSVSHDLKAPLRGIDGYGRLLQSEYAQALDDEGREFLQRIRQATQHMGQLIDDLLAYSRLERREQALQALPVREMIDEVLANARDEVQRSGALVSIGVDPGIRVRGDAQGLTMALRNLLDNALKFSRGSHPPRVQVDAQVNAGRVTVSVSDNGVGFDMKFHDRIFSIFQRLHRAEEYPGTGIGLAIVHKAMERMGGRTWARSGVGEGATFYLELPEATAP